MEVELYESLIKTSTEEKAIRNIYQKTVIVKQTQGGLDKIATHVFNGELFSVYPRDQDYDNLRLKLEDRMKPFAQDAGLVIVCKSLAVFAKLDIKKPLPDEILYDVCLMRQDYPTIIFSVVQAENRDKPQVKRYNLSVTKKLIELTRTFTIQDFYAVYGIVSVPELESDGVFKISLERIIENTSKLYIQCSLDMPGHKYRSVVSALLSLIARTDVVSYQNADYCNETVCLLTPRQFRILTECIDKMDVSVKTSHSCGATVLLLETAHRLERLGSVLIVTNDKKVLKIARQKNMKVFIPVEDENSDSIKETVENVLCNYSSFSKEQLQKLFPNAERMWIFKQARDSEVLYTNPPDLETERTSSHQNETEMATGSSEEDKHLTVMPGKVSVLKTLEETETVPESENSEFPSSGQEEKEDEVTDEASASSTAEDDSGKMESSPKHVNETSTESRQETETVPESENSEFPSSGQEEKEDEVTDEASASSTAEDDSGKMESSPKHVNETSTESRQETETVPESENSEFPSSGQEEKEDEVTDEASASSTAEDDSGKMESSPKHVNETSTESRQETETVPESENSEFPSSGQEEKEDEVTDEASASSTAEDDSGKMESSPKHVNETSTESRQETETVPESENSEFPSSGQEEKEDEVTDEASASSTAEDDSGKMESSPKHVNETSTESRQETETVPESENSEFPSSGQEEKEDEVTDEASASSTAEDDSGKMESSPKHVNETSTESRQETETVPESENSEFPSSGQEEKEDEVTDEASASSTAEDDSGKMESSPKHVNETSTESRQDTETVQESENSKFPSSGQEEKEDEVTDETSAGSNAEEDSGKTESSPKHVTETRQEVQTWSVLYVSPKMYKQESVKTIHFVICDKKSGTEKLLEMEPVTEDVWKVEISVPDNRQTISYRYRYGLAKEKKWTFNSSLSSSTKDTKVYHMQPGEDKFDVSDKADAVSSFSSFMCYMLLHGHHYPLEKGIELVENLCRSYAYDIRSQQNLYHVMETLNSFLKRKNVKVEIRSFVLLAYMYSKLIKTPEILLKAPNFTKEIAIKILISLKSELKELPFGRSMSASIRNIERILESCGKKAFPEKKCVIFKLMEYAFTVESASYFFTLLDTYIPKHEPDAEWNDIKKVLTSICKMEFAKESCSAKVITKILRHLSLDHILEIDSEVSKVLLSVDLDDILEGKIIKELKKKKQFYKIMQLFNTVRKCKRMSDKVMHETEQLLISLVSTRYSNEDEEVISGVFMLPNLFQNINCRCELLNEVVLSKSKGIHSSFIKLLGQGFVSASMPELCLSWFKTAIEHHCTMEKHALPMQDLPYLYSHLETITAVPVVKENEELKKTLYEEAYSFLTHTMKLNDVISAVTGNLLDEIQDSSDIQLVLRDHLRIYLDAQYKKSTQVFLSEFYSHDIFSSAVNVRGELQADLLIRGMEHSGVNEIMAEEDTVVAVLHQGKFWLSILEARGRQCSLVKSHPLYELVTKRVKSFIALMCTKTISLKCLRKTLDPVQENIDLFTQISRCVSPEVNDDTFAKHLQLLQTSAEEATLSCKSLFAILEHIETITEIDIPDLCLANDMLKTKDSDLSDGSVSSGALVDGSFWEYFSGVSKVCAEKVAVFDSEVFWKICQKIIQDMPEERLYGAVEHLDPVGDVRLLFGEEETIPSVTLNLINVITLQGVREYISTWEPLFLCQDKNKTIGSLQYIIDVNDFTAETKIAEEVYHRKIPGWVYDALKVKHGFQQHLNKLKATQEVLESLKCDIAKDTAFWSTVESFTAMQERDNDNLSLSKLHSTSGVVTAIDNVVDDHLLGVFKELRKAGLLVEFIKEKINDDFRLLIDAVEEHSEQTVQESTVSALIDVKRFLSPVIREKSPESVQKLLSLLQKQVNDLKITNLDQKISECVTNLHGLKSLFHNRGQVTKDIVQKALKKGSKMSFKLTEKKCHVQLKFREDKESKMYDRSDLNDLRSRVLLMKNTDAKGQRNVQVKVQESYEKFLDYVNEAMNVANVLDCLCETGHLHYKNFQQTQELPQLKSMYKELSTELKTWQNAVSESRRDYYWLNFFYPEQLGTLIHFMNCGDNEDKVQSLLSFTGLGLIDISSARTIYKRLEAENGTDKYSLPVLGATLDKAFVNIELATTYFPRLDELDMMRVQISSTVQKGKIFVAQLGEKSESAIPTLYTLYRNTTGQLPMPHQVLFCRYDTKWEDIELLLRRCFGAKDTCSSDQLFVIVSVENLSGHIQHQLVEALENEKDSHILIALIHKGSPHHSFLDHYGENVHAVEPISSSEIEEYFQILCPNVITVMSDVPGQGKTEYVHRRAYSQDLDVCSLHISGDISADTFVERLKCLTLSSSDILHIDIGMLSNPNHVDTLLFQLILSGMVSCGPNLFTLKTVHICIEVANTINSVLRNNLFTVVHFHRIELAWKNYEDFHASQEICSPVQVVCNYLNVFNEGTLDKCDLYFTGEITCELLPQKKSRMLLKKYFSVGSKMSFTIANIFLNVFSDQLKKFSCSSFFRTKNIFSMLGESQFIDVKSEMLKALLEMSKGFATRSVDACREDQKLSVQVMYQNKGEHKRTSLSASADAMAGRVKDMIQWAQSNHLIVVFHNQNFQTVSPLYRVKEVVPRNIENLFAKQINTDLPDYSTMDQKQLQETLTKIAKYGPGLVDEHRLSELSMRYALTPDNLLKMVLIVLRVRSHVPVIIMGETGCGKTSLITYLSVICGVELNVLNVHAGTEENAIATRVKTLNKEAEKCKRDVWLFLDEINTCNHLGFIAEILCHHRCQGHLLASNLIIMAACNPYKLRTEKSIFTAGLDSKVKADEQSKLVYRVHPLPENMIDYVWDYGSLSESDERAYISRMVNGVQNIEEQYKQFLITVLVYSQGFIRCLEEVVSCVSLRDVSRCLCLCEWFLSMLIQKHNLKYVHGSYDSNDFQVRAIILALAHTYHSRLPDTKQRQTYRKGIVKILKSQNISQFTSKKKLFDVIRREQDDMLDRMVLPPGIATNTALLENVFVLLVCILNHIPVFVVGKPGCSKSLSLQLIRSNLRGKDSDDPYFKTLPQLYCLSFQGSESSTSDGIIKVFEKAKRYRELNKEDDVLSVVVLDEIGLAETSRFNPLKVLHSLLEPGNTAFPDVAVVGISNWSLDAAKMNRAIHLSRPDMDVEELQYTGISISKAIVKGESESEGSVDNIDQKLIKAIACAYDDFVVKEPTFPNFYGLRDFYSLVKFVSKEKAKSQSIGPETSIKIIVKGLLRNFGGLSSEKSKMLEVFNKEIKAAISFSLPMLEVEKNFPVLELIKSNIEDSMSRHLLLSTQGETALSIVENLLKEMGREYELILGSNFEEDLTDEYDYRILSKIILSMEHGFVLLLKDLDSIYGSLYDMLNQNYTEVGLTKRCRIALGPYSNPLCHVHEDFRCIVLVEETDIDISDPPFLNRFEKQCIRMSDILSDREKNIVRKLETWLNDVSVIEGLNFQTCDLVPVFSSDMLSSLVHSIMETYTSSDLQEDDEYIILECKKLFLRACYPDGILRIDQGTLAKNNPDELKWIKEYYFGLPVHSGLRAYMTWLADQKPRGEMIFTHSNIHTSVVGYIQDIAKQCQFEKLGTFKSEKHLSQQICHFWQSAPKKEWLIVQCAPSMKNLLLMKSIMEKEMSAHGTSEGKEKKRTIIVLHMNRETPNELQGLINFLNGWNVTVIDNLEGKGSLPNLLKMSKQELIQDKMSVTHFIKQHLFWAFSLIQYTRPRKLDVMKTMVEKVKNSEKIISFIENKIMMHLGKTVGVQQSEKWQLEVACDRWRLYKYSTLQHALEEEINVNIKKPLAAIVFQIETESAWETALDISPKDERKFEVWIKLAENENIIDVARTPAPDGPACYQISDNVHNFLCPFSRYFINRVQCLKVSFFQGVKSRLPDLNLNEITKEQRNTLINEYQSTLTQKVVELTDNPYGEAQIEDYFTDFCNMFSNKLHLKLSDKERIDITKWLFWEYLRPKEHSLESFVTCVHICGWLYQHQIEAKLRLLDSYLQIQGVDLKRVLNMSRNPNQVEEDCAVNISENDEDKDLVIQQEEEDSSIQLVDVVCNTLLPRASLVNSRTSLRTWINNVSTIIVLASEVSMESKVYQSLRVCRDFAVLVSVPGQLPYTHLNSLAKALTEGTPETDESFESMKLLIKSLKECPSFSVNSVQHFFACFMSSCLAADPDTLVIQLTFENCEDLSLFQSSFVFLGPTLLQVLQTEIENSDISEIEKTVSESDVLKSLDDCLRLYKPNMHLACLVLEIIYTNFLQTNSFNFNSSHLETLLHCDKVFRSEKCFIQYLFAIAFMKRSLAAFIETDRKIPQDASQKVHRIFHLDKFGKSLEMTKETRCLHLFYIRLRRLNGGLMYMNTLKEQCAFMSDIAEESCFCSLELRPMKMTVRDDYEQISSAYSSLPDERRLVEDLCEKSKTNKETTYALFAFALQEIYIIGGLHHLADTDRTGKAKTFCQIAVKNLSRNQEKLFNCLCTCDTFEHQLLQISSETDAVKQNIRMCVLHLACLVLADNSNDGNLDEMAPVWLTLIQKPKDMGNYFIPGNGIKISSLHNSLHASLFSEIGSGSLLRCSYCRSVTVMNLDKKTLQICPICKEPMKDKETSSLVLSSFADKDIFRVQKGYVYMDVESMKDELMTVRELSPASFRLLQFLIHGCLAASLALQFSNYESLSEIMGLSSGSIVAELLDAHLLSHWRALKSFTQFEDTDLANLIHFFLKDGMLKHFKHQTNLTKSDELITFEKRFTTYVDEMMRNRFVELQNEMKAFQEQHPHSSSALFELHLKDVDTSETELVEYSRLMQITYPPSVQNMKTEFIILNNVKEFPVTALLTERESEVSLLQHFMPLLKWHMSTIQYGGYSLKRKDCKSKTVEVFIDDINQPELKTLYHNFKDSWNTLVEHEMVLKRFNSHLPPLRLVNIDSLLEECLVMVFNDSAIVEVLKALSAIQNNFLKDLALLCMSLDAQSVSFMKTSKGVVVLKEVFVQDITPKQVITLPESGMEKMLKFSQISTEFGHSQERQYDFYQIENSLKKNCLVHKPLILMETSFPIIIFTGEVLNTIDTVLEEVENITGREDISDAVKSKVTQSTEMAQANLHTMLDYIGMVFSLFKQTPVSSTSRKQTLDDFLSTWKSLLPNALKGVEGVLSQVQIGQIISLYDFIENLAAVNIVSNLDRKYRQKLPDVCVGHLQAELKTKTVHFQEVLVTALKKVAFRYLQSPSIKASDRLSSWMGKKTLWPTNVSPPLEVFHQLQSLEHIYETIGIIEKSIELSKRSGISSKEKPTPEKRLKERRMKASTFME